LTLGESSGRVGLMQIFVLDERANHCAAMLNLKNCCKAIVENFQLLCNVFPEDTPGLPYRRTHYNHPCSLWARTSGGNFCWLDSYTRYLLLRYTHVYGKTHKCTQVRDWIGNNFSLLEPAYITRPKTPFIFCGPEKYKAGFGIIDEARMRSDAIATSNARVISAYRAYYIEEKAYFSKWENEGAIPSWFMPPRPLINGRLNRQFYVRT
jgi:hypothetical protein